MQPLQPYTRLFTVIHCYNKQLFSQFSADFREHLLAIFNSFGFSSVTCCAAFSAFSAHVMMTCRFCGPG